MTEKLETSMMSAGTPRALLSRTSSTPTRQGSEASTMVRSSGLVRMATRNLTWHVVEVYRALRRPLRLACGLTLATIALAAQSACDTSAPRARCGASFVADESAWAANGYGAPDWYAPDPGGADYFQYTDEAGDPVADDPATGDPSPSDPGTDPGTSDPSVSDPGVDELSTSRVPVRGVPPPPSSTRLRPASTPPDVDAEGCFRCALTCASVTAPSVAMRASGASATSVSDACQRARRAINAWSAHTGNPIGSCDPSSY
jgi:hypothetical protein